MESAVAFSTPAIVPRGVTPASETIVGSGVLRGAETADRQWLHEVLVQVKEFLLLDDRWDAGVAAPISQDAVDNARLFLRVLHEAVSALRRPFVSPTVNGGVNLEWHDAHAHFDVTFESEDRWVYAQSSTVAWEGPLGEVTTEALGVLVENFTTR